MRLFLGLGVASLEISVVGLVLVGLIVPTALTPKGVPEVSDVRKAQIVCIEF